MIILSIIRIEISRELLLIVKFLIWCSNKLKSCRDMKCVVDFGLYNTKAYTLVVLMFWDVVAVAVLPTRVPKKLVAVTAVALTFPEKVVAESTSVAGL